MEMLYTALPFKAKRVASWNRNFADGWWGEGDDMIFVDHEPFPGSLHGTGSEDYFNQAWGVQDLCYPYAGTSLFNREHRNWEGQWAMYRFHIQDPIPFQKHLRVTIEHGHNNHRSDDYSSTAYWYQYPIVAARLYPRSQNACLGTSILMHPDHSRSSVSL